jgi:hypothetical protein
LVGWWLTVGADENSGVLLKKFSLGDGKKSPASQQSVLSITHHAVPLLISSRREWPKWNLVTAPFISFPRPAVNRILEGFKKNHNSSARGGKFQVCIARPQKSARLSGRVEPVHSLD